MNLVSVFVYVCHFSLLLLLLHSIHLIVVFLLFRRLDGGFCFWLVCSFLLRIYGRIYGRASCFQFRFGFNFFSNSNDPSEQDIKIRFILNLLIFISMHILWLLVHSVAYIEYAAPCIEYLVFSYRTRFSSALNRNSKQRYRPVQEQNTKYKAHSLSMGECTERRATTIFVH